MQRLNRVGVVPTLVVEGVHGNERAVGVQSRAAAILPGSCCSTSLDTTEEKFGGAAAL